MVNGSLPVRMVGCVLAAADSDGRPGRELGEHAGPDQQGLEVDLDWLATT
jgi:hypothetical protein